jgi:hypothetical protein
VRPVIVVPLALLALAVGAATAASRDAGAPITIAQATAFIRAVNLQPSDLPGSGPFTGEEGSPPDAVEIQHSSLRCGHFGRAPGRAINAEGAALETVGPRKELIEVLGSAVVVMPSEELAEDEIAALGSRSGRVCLAHGLRRGGLGEGGPGSARYATSVTFVPVAGLLGHGAVAVNLRATLRKAPARRSHLRLIPPSPSVYASEAIFRVGAADIAFMTLSEHRRFPAGTERRLLSLLYSRAKAHEL